MPPAKKVGGGGALPPPRLLEREEFSDSIRSQGAELKSKFLFRVFMVFICVVLV